MTQDEIEAHILMFANHTSDCDEADFGRKYLPRLWEIMKAAQYLLHNVNRDYAQWKIPLEKAFEELEKE